MKDVIVQVDAECGNSSRPYMKYPEDSSALDNSDKMNNQGLEKQEIAGSFYRTRIQLLSTDLRDVPDGFRLMPGMKVRAEVKVGKRSVITYFLYPIIRAFDESLREP